MAFQRIDPPDALSDERRRRNEWIGRGTLLVVGLLILWAGWKLWGAAEWASEQDATWNAVNPPRRTGEKRPIPASVLLYSATVIVGLAGLVTCAMSFMSISLMDRLFKPKPPITHDDGTGDHYSSGRGSRF